MPPGELATGGSGPRPESGSPLTSGALFGVMVLSWGLNYLFVRAGLGFSPPLWLAAGRTVLGALTVAGIVRLLPRGSSPLDRRGRIDAMLLGLPTSALFFGLWFVGEGAVLPGEAAVIVYTFPLWVALLARPVLGRRLPLGSLAAILLGFGGIVLVTEPWSAAGSAAPLWAIAELLAAAICWAVGTVLYQRRFPGPQMQEANLYQLLGGGLALVVASALVEPHLPAPSVDLVLVLLWLGVVGTGIAYAIWFSLLARLRAEDLAAFVFLVPVVALGFSALLLGERLDLIQGIGVVAVLAGIYVTGRRRAAPAP